MLSESALDELAVLYVVPVMLAGLELGVPGGAGGAAIAVMLLFAASGRHSELAAVGLAASGASFLIAGVLAGRFSERMRAARTRQARLVDWVQLFWSDSGGEGHVTFGTTWSR